MKRSLLALILLIGSFAITCCYSQTKYDLGNYQIDTENKTISVLSAFIRSNGNITSRGQEYIPDSSIDFDHTTLYILGNQFVPKEHIYKYLPEQADLSTFRVLEIHLNQYGKSICRDKNFLYRNSLGTAYASKWESIDLSGYQTINAFIYEKDKELYFLSKDFSLDKIKDIRLHIPTVKHIAGNYFTDKNGLYLLGGYRTQAYDALNKQWINTFRNGSIILDQPKGKNIKPDIYKDYFVYNNKVYASGYFDENKPLPLDAQHIKAIDVNHIRNSGNDKTNLLADASHTLVSDINGGYVPLASKYGQLWFTKNEFFQKDVDQWQLITPNIYKEEDGTSLYIPSAIKPATNKGYMGILIRKQNDFYTFTLNENDALKKFKQVSIFNYDTHAYEAIDITRYRYLAKDIWIYKGRLYVTNSGLPVKEAIETKNLDFLTLRDEPTNYLISGSTLIYIGNVQESGSLDKDGIKMQTMSHRIAAGVDLPSLKIISADLLIDKNNLYKGNYTGLKVIPIAALKVHLKAFTE